MNDYPIIVRSIRYQAVDNLMPTLPEKPMEPELKLVKKNWFEKLILWCDDYDDQEINNRRTERYEEQMRKYRKDLVLYQSKVNEILSETNISIFRQLERERKISTTSRGEDLDHDVIKGRYEKSFVTLLKEHFSSKITDQIEFTLPNGNSFVPDAAYIDSVSGLCIDIEIDEPYTIPDGKPIHYIGGSDDYRNNFFAERGWFVIRFAEEQVAKYPKECITFIEQFISMLSVGAIPIFRYPVNRWSYSDSHSLFLNNFRQTY